MSRRTNQNEQFFRSPKPTRDLCERLSSTDTLCIALVHALRPPSKPVCDVTAITVCSNTQTQVAGRINRAGVVHSRSAVVTLGAISCGFVEELFQTIAVRRALNAIINDLVNLVFWARVLHR